MPPKKPPTEGGELDALRGELAATLAASESRMGEKLEKAVVAGDEWTGRS